MRFNTILNQGALAGKGNLSIFKVNWETPIEVEGGILGGLSTTNRALLVPKGKVSAYQASPTWSGFTEIYDDRVLAEYTVTGTTAVPTGSISKILYHSGTKSSAFTGNHSFPEAGKFYCLSASGVTTVSNDHFRGSTALTKINTMAATVINDGSGTNNGAFCGCNNLAEAILPNVTSIGNYAFFENSSLTKVEMPKATNVGNTAFNTCPNLTEAIMPNVTSIGTYAFDGDSGLTNVEMPKVQTIGTSAFGKCSGLTKVEISQVTSIGASAFSNCRNLQTVIINNPTPPTLSNTSAFGNTHADLKFYVPADAVNTYKAASVWSSFASKIYPI